MLFIDFTRVSRLYARFARENMGKNLILDSHNLLQGLLYLCEKNHLKKLKTDGDMLFIDFTRVSRLYARFARENMGKNLILDSHNLLQGLLYLCEKNHLKKLKTDGDMLFIDFTRFFRFYARFARENLAKKSYFRFSQSAIGSHRPV